MRADLGVRSNITTRRRFEIPACQCGPRATGAGDLAPYRLVLPVLTAESSSWRMACPRLDRDMSLVIIK